MNERGSGSIEARAAAERARAPEDSERLERVARAGAAALRRGAVVAVPTETQYALCVLASNAEAVRRCYALKARPLTEAMPILLPDAGWLERVGTGISAGLRALAAAAWPGPLTLVVRRNPAWRSLAAAGETVAVRVPDHPVARAVLAAVGEPITGSSANRHGEAPALTADDAQATFGRAVMVLPALGLLPRGAASTILDCAGPAPRLLRVGAVEAAAVAALVAAHLPAGSDSAPPAGGAQ